jgi:hypothetical protein
MRRMRATVFSLAVVLCTMATLTLAQSPIPPEGQGTVIAVDAQGKATVQIKDKEHMVELPGAKVGDKVDCKVKAEKLDCTVQRR